MKFNPRWSVTAAVLVFVAGGPLSACEDPADRSSTSIELDKVIQIERDFAAASLQRGSKRSFLEYVAADGVIFRPGPVPAYATILKDPDDDQRSTLDWWPAMGAISQSADLALSVGPWVANDPAASDFNERQVYGYYATVWRKQADGRWRFVIDGAGARLSGPPHRAKSGPVLKMPISTVRPIRANEAMRQIRALEAELTKRTRRVAPKAIGSLLVPAAWIMGSGLEPSPGSAGQQAELSKRPSKLSLDYVGGGASKAGDLAYTYGLVKSLDPTVALNDASYLHVWQRTGAGWGIIFQGIKSRR